MGIGFSLPFRKIGQRKLRLKLKWLTFPLSAPVNCVCDSHLSREYVNQVCNTNFAIIALDYFSMGLSHPNGSAFRWEKGNLQRWSSYAFVKFIESSIVFLSCSQRFSFLSLLKQNAAVKLHLGVTIAEREVKAFSSFTAVAAHCRLL